MPFIEVDHVSKEFKIARAKPGVLGMVSSLFHREYTIRRAVEDMSFSLEKGEVVGYIGPNGAGKSTTIKMLSGVLTPTAGRIAVDGIVPYEDRKRNARRIGVVFGQRSQLYWDLPIADTFSLYQKLYEIPEETYRANRALYTELLSLDEVMEQPVRQLSLGQKMKANLALAMLHDPAVLYLDEPTIGLDVMSRRVLRESVKALNREKETTIILTTHDMADIEAVCGRLILIDKGKKLFDGSLDAFKSRYESELLVTLHFEQTPPVWQADPRFALEQADAGQWTVRVAQGLLAKEAFVALIDRYTPENISMREQNIEDIIAKIFRAS